MTPNLDMHWDKVSATHCPRQGGPGGAIAGGDDNDVEMGGGAVGHGELEPCFEPAGRPAKASSENAKVQEVRTNPFMFANPLPLVGNTIAGFGLSLWARSRRPHPLSLLNFGIRIVAPIHYQKSRELLDQDRVYTALLMLKDIQPTKFESVAHYIKIVIVHQLATDPRHFRFNKICHLNLERLETAQPERAITIAGVLVYFATLASVRDNKQCSDKDAKAKDIARNTQEEVVNKIVEYLSTSRET